MMLAPTTGSVGTPEPASRASPSPTNQSPRLPTPVGALTPFPPRRDPHCAPPGSPVPALLLSPRRLNVAMSPPTPIPLLLVPTFLPPKEAKRTRDRAVLLPRLWVGLASVGGVSFLRVMGPVPRWGFNDFAIFEVPRDPLTETSALTSILFFLSPTPWGLSWLVNTDTGQALRSSSRPIIMVICVLSSLAHLSSSPMSRTTY